MKRVLILGAGKIGRAIAQLLARSGDYQLVIGDVDERALERMRDVPASTTRKLDVTDRSQVLAVMKGCWAVISACQYAVNPLIADAAREAGISYFDLTEDVETTRSVRESAQSATAGQVFMPQCGLAPGFVGIAAHALTQGFDQLDEVKLRVGALAQFPTGELKYNLTWSTDGLINEYCNPCEAIRDGRKVDVEALEGLEHFALDGVDYEAFNTSGGLGTLWETLSGRVRNLDYKTVRYQGHRDLVRFLIRELRLSERRHILKEIFEHAVPATTQDVVLIFCVVTGMRNGAYTQVTDARKIYHAQRYGEIWSGIQITTASSMCAVLDLHRTGRLPDQGFVSQDRVVLSDFLSNRFGSVYAQAHESVTSLKAGGQ
jgi:saccharopine dehydrogenase-like NADP-dependent oxidoreductase